MIGVWHKGQAVESHDCLLLSKLVVTSIVNGPLSTELYQKYSFCIYCTTIMSGQHKQRAYYWNSKSITWHFPAQNCADKISAQHNNLQNNSGYMYKTWSLLRFAQISNPCPLPKTAASCSKSVQTSYLPIMGDKSLVSWPRKFLNLHKAGFKAKQSSGSQLA